jgi:hypothetical protein
MAITLADKMKGLSPARRTKIEARTADLVREQMTSPVSPKSSRGRAAPSTIFPTLKQAARRSKLKTKDHGFAV